MSQYSPPPYQPPQPIYGMPPGYPYNAAPNAPARRAGILLFVLGGLAVLGGLCCGLSGSMIDQILAQRPEMAQQLPPEATPQMLRIVMLVFAGVSLIYGVGLLLLGPFVLKGSKPAIITAMVLAILTLLGILIRAIFMGAQGAGAIGGDLCISIVPLSLYALLLAWLIQALRQPSAAQAAGQYPPEYLAYLQQQYAQQQQAYQAWQQQQGGQTPPPPVPPQTPPPPPPPPEGPTSGSV